MDEPRMQGHGSRKVFTINLVPSESISVSSFLQYEVCIIYLRTRWSLKTFAPCYRASTEYYLYSGGMKLHPLAVTGMRAQNNESGYQDKLEDLT